MKITKTQLSQLIKEEMNKVLEEDQGAFVRGAKGAGQDTISVDKIRISPGGNFKAKVSSAQLEKPLRIAGQLDHNSTALLQQAGALEKSKEITPFQKELNDKLGEIIGVYDGAELPPSLSTMKGLFNDGKHSEVKDAITDYWNELLNYHKKTGIRLQHKVTTEFNALNTLLRKMD